MHRKYFFFCSTQAAGLQRHLLLKMEKFACTFSAAAVLSRQSSSRALFSGVLLAEQEQTIVLRDNSTLPDRRSARLSKRERMRGALFDSGNSAKGHRHQGNRRNEPRGFQVVLMRKLSRLEVRPSPKMIKIYHGRSPGWSKLPLISGCAFDTTESHMDERLGYFSTAVANRWTWFNNSLLMFCTLWEFLRRCTTTASHHPFAHVHRLLTFVLQSWVCLFGKYAKKKTHVGQRKRRRNKKLHQIILKSENENPGWAFWAMQHLGLPLSEYWIILQTTIVKQTLKGSSESQ